MILVPHFLSGILHIISLMKKNEMNEIIMWFSVHPPPGESGMEKGWVPEVIVTVCVSYSE